MNLTAQWVERNGQVLRSALVQHLQWKMTKSALLGLVEDHVQEFILHMIDRDTLAPYLRSGREVNTKALQVWAYQSASTELRRWGVDASLRASRGAQTTRARAQGAAWRVVQTPDFATEVHPCGDESNVVFQFTRQTPPAVVDYTNPRAETPMDALTRDARVEHVRSALTRAGYSNVIPVVLGLVEGEKLTDLCAKHDVTPQKVTEAVRHLRYYAEA